MIAGKNASIRSLTKSCLKILETPIVEPAISFELPYWSMIILYTSWMVSFFETRMFVKSSRCTASLSGAEIFSTKLLSSSD